MLAFGLGLVGLAVFGAFLLVLLMVITGVTELFTLPSTAFIVTVVMIAVFTSITAFVLRTIPVVRFVPVVVAIASGGIYAFVSFIDTGLMAAAAFTVSTGLFLFGAGIVPVLSSNSVYRERQLRVTTHVMWVYPFSVIVYGSHLTNPPNGVTLGAIFTVSVIVFFLFARGVRSL